MNLAVIPARGGSSRIPKKNIREFAGRPIISYPIQAAISSGLFDQVVVSTDSQEIAEVARQAGAQTPFMRPAELGQNAISVAQVLRHAIEWFQDQGQLPQYTCCLVATAPFLKAEYLAQGHQLMRERRPDTVMSVCQFPFPVLRALEETGDGLLAMKWPEYELAHSNQLAPAYHDAAQFYWVDTAKFLRSNSFFGQGLEVLPVVLPPYLVRDIDTPEDWETAEVMYQTCRQRGLL